MRVLFLKSGLYILIFTLGFLPLFLLSNILIQLINNLANYLFDFGNIFIISIFCLLILSVGANKHYKVLSSEGRNRIGTYIYIYGYGLIASIIITLLIYIN